MASTWDPELYNRFRAQRHQPFADLAALIAPQQAPRVLDLGCGDGELTARLHAQLGAAATLGVDNSATMLARAAALATPRLGFARADIAIFAPRRPLDVVFSNAALHWVEDHAALFRRLAAFLAPGGQLAVQMPANQDHVAHRAAAAVAQRPPFRAALGGYTGHHNVLPPERYAELLDDLGFRRQHVRLQVYAHHLPDRDAVLEWMRGTTLTAFQARLTDELFADFVAAYAAELRAALPDRRPFFYPFKRILIHASH